MAIEEGLSPHGESGLKCPLFHLRLNAQQSLPSRGEWIEIAHGKNITVDLDVSPLTGRVD